MTRRILGILCWVAASLGVSSSLFIAFQLYQQRADGYSSAVYAALSSIVIAEIVVSVMLAFRRSMGRAVLFAVFATPLAIYECTTAVAGVGIAYFSSIGALAVGVAVVIAFLVARRFSSGLSS